jgi:2'-5' RNA ligase
MRLFIAVFPPPELQAVAWRAAEPLRVGRDAVSWVRAENLHFTLRFLGELDASGAARATDAMLAAAAAHARFGATVGGFGAFPTARRARVLWIGMLHGAEPMRLLATSLEHALKQHGFERADESFEPHLTVGRLRTAADWTARLIETPTVEARFQVSRVQLLKSTTGGVGSTYELLSEAHLAGKSR